MIRKTDWSATWAALVGVALVIALGLAGIRGMMARSGNVTATRQKATEPILASARVCQTFVAEYPALYKVKVFMATYARQNTGALIFEVRSAPDAATLATQTVDLMEIQDNAYHSFEFPAILDAEERSLAFCLRVPDGQTGNAVGAWGTVEDTYRGGQALFEGISGSGIEDLAFALGYRFSLPETIAAVARNLAASKPAVWGEAGTYLGLGMLYLTLLYGFVYRLAREK